MPAYGYVLSAGGWALSYFTAYAAYHLESVRIIHNPVVALLLMLGISCGAVLHFLRLRSELITSISLSLAFLTMCFSNVSLFTLISCAVLVVSLVFIVSKMRWYWLYLAGVLASYGIYLLLLLPHVTTDPWIQSLGFTSAQSAFWLTISFSSLFWGAFTYGLMTLDESSPRKKTILISASLVNFLAYVFAVLSAMDPVYPEKRFAFVLSLGVAYLMSASRGMKSILPSITTLHTVFALFLFSLSVPLHFTNSWTSTIWSLEIPLLAYIGVKNRMPLYSRFANALALFSFFGLVGYEIWQTTPVYAPLQIEHGKVMGIIATAAYMAAFTCHRWFQRANSRSSRAYFLMAACIASCSTLHFGSGSAWQWLPLMFVAGGGMAAYLGFSIRDVFTRRIGELGIFFGSVPLIFNYNNVFPTLATICTLVLIDRMYKPYESSKVSTVRVRLNVGVLFFLGMLSQKLVDSHALIATWAVLAATLLYLGFALKDAAYRDAAVVVGAIAGVWFNFAAPLEWGTPVLGASWRDITAFALCATAALSAYLFYQPKHREVVGNHWQSAFVLSVSFGYAILLKLLSVQLDHQYLPLAYGLASVIPLAVGILTSQSALRVVGWTTGIALPLLALGFNVSQWHTGATFLLSLILYGYGFLFKQMRIDAPSPSDGEDQAFAKSSFLSKQLQQQKSPMEQNLEHVFSFIATAIMTLIVGQHGGDCLSLLWALQGFTLLAAGFAIKDKLFRVYGLALLSMVSAKLVFVDTATLEMTYRIMSFIAVGLVLLVTSFFYLRFAGHSSDRKTPGSLNAESNVPSNAESTSAEAA